MSHLQPAANAKARTGGTPARRSHMRPVALAKLRWNSPDLVVPCDLLDIYGESGEDIYPEG